MNEKMSKRRIQITDLQKQVVGEPSTGKMKTKRSMASRDLGLHTIPVISRSDKR
jgi:hypothetical protein